MFDLREIFSNPAVNLFRNGRMHSRNGGMSTSISFNEAPVSFISGPWAMTRYIRLNCLRPDMCLNLLLSLPTACVQR